MKKFSSATELLSFLENEMNLQSYNLTEGFDQFANKVLSTDGSSSLEDVKAGFGFNTFDWRTESGDDVNVKIAIAHEETEEDEFRYYYFLK